MLEYYPFRPKNLNAKIWRFMDFTKFVSLLDTRCLFFCRSDKLGDPFEGSAPLGNYVASRKRDEGILAPKHSGERAQIFVHYSHP